MQVLPSTILGLWSPLACFALHVLLFRLIPKTRFMQRQKITVFVIVAAVASLTALSLVIGANVSEAAHVAVLSLLFGYTYFHWFNMSETARRISILVRYVDSGAAAATGQANYGTATIYSQRIERLRDVGTLYERDGRLFVKKGPLWIATKLILFWRALFYPKK